MKLLDDYRLDDRLRYEGHKLVYTQDGNEDIVIQGILGAALLCALLVDTEEGDARGIAIDTEAQQKEFFALYERNVRREGWGMLNPEIQHLHDAYVQLSLSNLDLSAICPNIRLLDLALQLTVRYMQHLVLEIFGEHIWIAYPWKTPFAQWLWDAARVETRRQRFLHTNWTDPVAVTTLADMPDEGEVPTLFFEGEAAEDIMNRYYEWMWENYQKQVREIPGSKITAADKRHIIEYESDWLFLSDEINMYDEEGHRAWLQWMSDWQDFLTRKLKPEKEIKFWTPSVPQEMQEKLLDYLKAQERQPQHYKCLAVAVYTLRQLGYITYNIASSSIAKWLSERLQNDYSSKTGLYQFRRAWNELRRYHPAVQDELEQLAEYSIRSIK
jgi:hypothetical protein